MATRSASSRFWLTWRHTPTTRPTCLRCHFYSTTAPTPAAPVLSKLRIDLKTAMRAKDTQRLSVLRGLLAEITNSTKTSSPIDNDMALLSLLRKRINSSKTAMEDFEKANRKDLVDKEQEQVGILEEYASGIQTLGTEEMTDAVRGVIEALKSEGGKLVLGDVLRRTIGAGGALEGKMVDKGEVARIVKEELGVATS